MLRVAPGGGVAALGVVEIPVGPARGAEAMRLLDVVGDESAALDDLARDVSRLLQAREARRRLAGLPAEQLRAALGERRRQLGAQQ